MSVITHLDPLVTELVRVLGLPKQTIMFTIRATVDRPVEVDCTYYPTPEKSMVVTERYQLVKVKDSHE